MQKKKSPQLNQNKNEPGNFQIENSFTGCDMKLGLDMCLRTNADYQIVILRALPRKGCNKIDVVANEVGDVYASSIYKSAVQFACIRRGECTLPD